LKLEEHITEPGYYLFQLEDQGGHPSWRMMKVYDYPVDPRSLENMELELRVSEVSAGHQGINHALLKDIWNCAAVEKWVDPMDIVYLFRPHLKED